MYKKIIFYLLLTFFVTSSIFALGIYDSDKYAWGEETGWINWKTTNGNVNIIDTNLSGKIWSDNYGWINLNPTNGGIINNGSGVLSGNAWGENLGWINFSGVSIDENGFLKGTASTENNGDIAFEGINVSVRSFWNNKKTPTDIVLDNHNINENNLVGNIIGTLSTSDLNSTDTHIYSLNCSSAGEDDINFDINNNTIVSSHVFDFENPDDLNLDNNYEICIRVTDNTGLYFNKNFTINIDNLLDPINTNNCLDHDLQGFAWSDGVGWISFDCKSAGSNIDYGVDVDKNGNLTGYAWSDAIGWISFDYYNAEDSKPKYNKNTQKLEGYIKALSGLEESDDNWNGKISLSGISSNGSSYAPEYNTNTFEFTKYAWGGNNVGWIDFKTNYGVVIMDPFYFRFTSNKGTDDNPVDYDGNVILSWETDGAISCKASDGENTTWTNNINKSIGNPNSSSETISNLKSNKIFSLTCTDSFGNQLKKTIDISVKPAPPELFLYSDDNNIGSNTSTKINWNIKNVENCKLTSSTGINTNINSSDGIHNRTSGNLTDSTNWFKVVCDSNEPTYYPNGVEEIIYIDVEKLILEFYPETALIKFNDRIKLYWKPEFAVSCSATGDITDFNGNRDSSAGLHDWESSKQETEGVIYVEKLKCIGTVGQELEIEINIRVGKNPRYQEI